MYKGINVTGTEFFNLLYESVDFTSMMGKMTLASSRLESQILLFLKNNDTDLTNDKATLGKLIIMLVSKKLIDKPLEDFLNLVKDQRNYLTHNISALLSDLMVETILERHNLIDSDVSTYIDRAYELKENLNELADIFKNMNE
ncbi:MAG: hypothetical protein OEW67_05050 [Cyclobacteriaceae bacterium]|nr:hypothetical protein [Cyclobacteriaceae bacterium]